MPWDTSGTSGWALARFTIHCDVIQYEELLAKSDGGGTGAGDVLQWCMIMPDANIWLTICIHCTMYATMTDIAIDSL